MRSREEALGGGGATWRGGGVGGCRETIGCGNGERSGWVGGRGMHLDPDRQTTSGGVVLLQK